MHKDLENPHYSAWKDFLAKADRWDEKAVKEYELSEIKRIINLAFTKTRGYRKLFESAGIKPENVTDFESFSQIPFTTKEIFQNNLEDFSVKKQNRIYVTTGGSSGIPLGMYRDEISFARELASKAHQYKRVGWKEGDRQMVFRGLPIDSADYTEFVEEFNELRCSTYQFIPEYLELYRRKAFEYKPDWIRCYPSAGFLFASFLDENKLEFPKVKGILCASEMLYDFQKEMMKKVFGCRVFSHYGHYEMAALASFCEFNDFYHVLPQYGFVELIDETGNPMNEKGGQGEIVATSFIMETTPFIRYRTGDMAILKGWNCPDCGRPYQIWEKIVGRRQEMIVAKDGRLFSMTMLNMHDDIYDQLRQYQFFQNEKGRIKLRFVPKEFFTGENIETIKKRLKVKLGESFEIDVEQVDKIEITKRGKHKTLIQKLNIESRNLSLD